MKNTTNNKEITIRKGQKFLMNVRGVTSEFKVVSVEEKTVTLKNPDGVEKKFLRTIVNSALNKQDELRAAISGDDDNLDDILDEQFPDEIEAEDVPAPAPEAKSSAKKGKAAPVEAKPKKEAKVDKYWENEDPYLTTLEDQELRLYEEAGKLQVFSLYEKDGEKHPARGGVTFDVKNMSEKDAMKLISYFVYAVRDCVDDARINDAIEIIENVNSEINPEDYVFTMAELKAMPDETVLSIAKRLGVSTKSKDWRVVCKGIIQAQNDIQAGE